MSNIGCDIQNLGLSGSGFARLSSENKNYINRVAEIDSDTDIIGISASFNDLGSGLPVGEVTDKGESSICGYINDFFDSLLSRFPHTPICVYTTNPWKNYHYKQNTDGDNYVSKLEEICKIRGLAFRSLYTCTSLMPWVEENNNYYFANADGTHPNNEGHKLLFRNLLPLFMTSAKVEYDFYY